MKKTIGIFTPNPRDATSFYRTWGPWSSFRSEFDIIPISSQDSNWVDLSGIDIAFIHRPFQQNHLNLANQCESMGIPIWCDFDDDLYNVHLSNANYHLYDNPQTRRIIDDICRKASIVTVSTKELLEIYGPRTKRCEVISNKLPEHILKNILSGNENIMPRKMILWRGTPHHDMNLQYYQYGFVELMQKNPKWCFGFYGFKPWYIVEKAYPGQVIHFAKPEIIEYLKDIQNIKAAIHVVPLIDHAFNRAKSSIAYLEAAGLCGSLVIAPDLEEWKNKVGVIHYKASDVKSFVDATQRAIDMRDTQRARLGRMARTYVQSSETLSSVREKRIDIIKSLVK